MIKLQKGAAPQVLIDNAAAWTIELLAKIAAGIKVSDAVGQRYSHTAIKVALLAETCEKCAYCESKITHIAYGDIEHIIAKAVDPALSLDWDNLTIACDKCNQNKSDHEGILDPYAVEPSNHLVFLGPLVKGNPDSELGMFTERTLKLNRTQLVERRAEKIDYLMKMKALAGRVADTALRDLIIEDIKKATESDQEYSAVLAACILVLGIQ